MVWWQHLPADQVHNYQFIIHHSLENLFPPIRRHQAAEFSFTFPTEGEIQHQDNASPDLVCLVKMFARDH